MYDEAVGRLKELLKDIDEDEHAPFDAFAIVSDISTALDESKHDQSADVLPKITDLVITLLKDTDTSNLVMTLQALQELQSILSMAESDERASTRIIGMIQFIINLFFKILSLVLGGVVRVSDGELTVDDSPVGQDAINQALGNQLLQRIVGTMTKLLQSILDMSSSWSVMDIFIKVRPLLESLLGSVSGGLTNVTKVVLSILTDLVGGLQGTGADEQAATRASSTGMCAEPSFHENTISIPIIHTVKIGDLNSYLNAELIALAGSNDFRIASQDAKDIKNMQAIVNDVAKSRSITPDQVEQLMPLISSLRAPESITDARRISTININFRTETLANPIPVYANLNLMPAIRRDLLRWLPNLRDISKAPPAQAVLDRLQTTMNELTAYSNPSAELIKVLILGYKLLQATGSNSSALEGMSPIHNLIKTLLNSLRTVTPTSRGVSSAVALLSTLINSLHQKGKLTLEQVISMSEKMVDNGQVTTKSLLKVLDETLAMIPNLPPRISSALNGVLEQLSKYGNNGGKVEDLIRSLKELQNAVDSIVASGRSNYTGAFQWLINVLLSIFSEDTALRKQLEPFLTSNVKVTTSVTGDCDPTSLLGALICPISDLVDDGSHGAVRGLNSLLQTLLGALG